MIETSIYQGISVQFYCSWLNLLVISGYDNKIELRNATNNLNLIKVLNAHRQPVFGIHIYQFNGNTFLLSGSWDS